MIIRSHRNTNYTTTSTYHLRDTSLSWQAMGMLTFMLSCREDFKFSIDGLTKCASNGNASTRSTLKELRDKGYIIVSPIRDGGRVVEWIYDIYEIPSDLLSVEKPDVEKPDVEKPHVENRLQSNINRKNNNVLSKDSTPINNNIIPSINDNIDDNNSLLPPIAPLHEKRFRRPTLDEVTAYCIERKNNVDPQHFISYYESNGWRVGRNPMKNWKAAIHTWERKEVKPLNKSFYGDTNNRPSNEPSRTRDYTRTTF